MIWSIALLLSLAAQDATAAAPAGAAASPPTPVANYLKFAGTPAYPPDAYRARQEGVTLVDLHVSAAGKVTACAIAQTSGSSSLDKASCSFARHIRFDPARDAAGTAVDGDVQYPMRWNLPPR